MAIPRRLLVVAASAVAAGVVWYVTKRSAAPKGRSPIDEGNDEKDRAEAEAKEKKKQAEQAAAGTSSSSSQATASQEPAAVVDSARKELALFLSGDAWHDEIGWQALWEKDGVAAPDAWLRDAGKAVLVTERQKLTDHPALLAGCRRRWIVVCRYAGIDVGEAAGIWNDA